MQHIDDLFDLQSDEPAEADFDAHTLQMLEELSVFVPPAAPIGLSTVVLEDW